MNKNKIHMVAFIILVAGGILLLLEGVFPQWDFSSFFTGQMRWLDRAIYVLVGLAAIYEIATHKANCKTCEAMTKRTPSPGQM